MSGVLFWLDFLHPRPFPIHRPFGRIFVGVQPQQPSWLALVAGSPGLFRSGFFVAVVGDDAAVRLLIFVGQVLDRVFR